MGTDVGVFYTDGTLADWVPYQTGLPNVVVTELQISYNINKLWASTFGRGLLNPDLYSGSSATEDEALNAEVKVFSNPTNSHFTIQVPENLTFDIAFMTFAANAFLNKSRFMRHKKRLRSHTLHQARMLSVFLSTIKGYPENSSSTSKITEDNLHSQLWISIISKNDQALGRKPLSLVPTFARLRNGK